MRLSRALPFALLAGPAAVQDLSPADLARQMAQGGTAIHIRHAQTEPDYADQVTADPLRCSTQRVLSEGGWQQARALGRAIAAHAIPAVEMLASQYRCVWQTADRAFGRYTRLNHLNFPPAEQNIPTPRSPRCATIRPRWSPGPSRRA